MAIPTGTFSRFIEPALFDELGSGPLMPQVYCEQFPPWRHPQRYDPRNIEFSIRGEFDQRYLIVDWHLEDLSGHICISDEAIANSRFPERDIRERVLDEVERRLHEPPFRNQHRDPSIPLFDAHIEYLAHPFSWQPHTEANQKAEKLLVRNLTQKQRETYTKNKFFYVNVPKDFGEYCGNYKITSQPTFNVLNEERGIRYCAAPKGSELLPLPDILLAQKLMLETAPKEFLSKANTRSIHPYTISTFAAI